MTPIKRNKNSSLQKSDNSGFTILEVAVSLFIITMGVLGIMTLVNQSLRVKDINKNKIIASQLAQEGIEIVRASRDNNWLDKEEWHQGVLQDGSYIVDYEDDVKDNTPDDLDATSTKLYLDDSGLYKHFASAGEDPATATSTSFRRIIKVSPISTPLASTSVKSIVEWKERGTSHRYTAETILYDWRKKVD